MIQKNLQATKAGNIPQMVQLRRQLEKLPIIQIRHSTAKLIAMWKVTERYSANSSRE